MGEMVERVARAMAESDPGRNIDWEYCTRVEGHPVPVEFRRRARAAIEAMREPTAAMEIRAGRDNALGDNLEPYQAWTRMIDAALEEEKADA